MSGNKKENENCQHMWFKEHSVNDIIYYFFLNKSHFIMNLQEQ